MKRFFNCVIAIAIILAFGSCTRRLTDFTVISTKNLPIGEGTNASFKKGNTRVKGQDVSHMVLCLPFGYPNMKEAIDRAIESTPGAVGLADGVVKTSSWNALLYGQNKYIVEGTPIFSSDANSENPAYNQNNNYGNTHTGKANPDTMVFYHNVKKDESLVEIAKLYGVKISDIMKWNNLNGSNISEGQSLIILVSE